MQNFKVAGVFAAALVMGSFQSAHADDSGWYAGFGAGRSLSRLDDARLARELSAPGFDPTAVDTDSHKTAYKAFGGYQFSRHFALEGSYFNLGKFGFSAPTAPAGALDGALSVRGFGFDAVGLLPFTDKLSAFAKIGASYAQTRDTFSATGGNVVVDSSPRAWHANPKIGAGLQFQYTEHFGVRAEWERYRISDAVRDHGNVDAWFVDLVFPFGRAEPVAVAPAEPAPPPPAPPVAQAAPAPQPAAPAPHRVTFDADALFAFDSSTLRLEGAHALDEFAAQLRGTRFAQVHVLGYTDRIGSAAYNRSLSQRRADAVKAYLVDHAAVDAAKISAEGKGSSDPVTKPGQCGRGHSRAVIACLQPDRRVEIEVAGTQR